ncbi:MAG: glycosyltransferase family 39 protein [Lachnospiraceae bacterium]|nr:glycosyltransferase family 39 protein [Lachnospiraceae bacterium]
MKKTLKDKVLVFLKEKKIVYVLVFALVARFIFWMIYVKNGGDGHMPDTDTYMLPAVSFFEEGNFGYTIRTPGYPLFLSLMMCFDREGYYGFTVVFQILMNVSAIYILYRLCKEFFTGEKYALIAAGIASLNFLDMYYDCVIQSDSPAQTFLIVCVYFFVKFVKGLKEKKAYLRYIIPGACALVYAILLRPAFMYLPIAFLLGFSISAIVYRFVNVRFIVGLLCMVLICYIPMGCWSSHNREYLGFDGYAYISSYNLYMYNAAAVYAKQNGIGYNEACVVFQKGEDQVYQEYRMTMSEQEAQRKRGMELIKSDITYYLLQCLKGVAYLYVYPGVLDIDRVFGFGLEELKDEIKESGFSVGMIGKYFSEHWMAFLAMILDFILLIAMTGVGIAGAVWLWKKDWIPAALLLGVLLYCTVVYCQPVGAGAYCRFRISISMIISVFNLGFFALRCEKKNVNTAKKEKTA